MEKERKIVLTAECVCDIPEHILKEIDVNIIHYNIWIEGHEYQTETEINTENVLEYIKRSREKARACAPRVEEYRRFFKENIKGDMPLLHLVLHSEVGPSYENAVEAAKDFPQVQVFDSKQMSGGFGLLVLAAAEAADEGKSIESIIDTLEKMQERVNASFLVNKGNYYIYDVWNFKKRINHAMKRFPVCLVVQLEEGKLKASYGKMRFGTVQECYRSYIRGILRNSRPDKGQLLVTHTGCNKKQQEAILKEIEKYVHFDRIIVNTASAAVTCNCGGQNISLQFLNER